jgi:hypothetical protein
MIHTLTDIETAVRPSLVVRYVHILLYIPLHNLGSIEYNLTHK